MRSAMGPASHLPPHSIYYSALVTLLIWLLPDSLARAADLNLYMQPITSRLMAIMEPDLPTATVKIHAISSSAIHRQLRFLPTLLQFQAIWIDAASPA